MSVKKYRRAVFLIIMLILTIVFYFIFCGGKNAIGNVLAGVINGAGNFLAGEYVPSYTFYDSVESQSEYTLKNSILMIFIRQVNITEYMQGRAKRVYHMTVMLIQ